MDKQPLLGKLELLIRQYQCNGLNIRFNLIFEDEDEDTEICQCENKSWYVWSGGGFCRPTAIDTTSASEQELLDSCSELLMHYESSNNNCVIGACISFLQNADSGFCTCHVKATDKYHILAESGFSSPTFSL